MVFNVDYTMDTYIPVFRSSLLSSLKCRNDVIISVLTALWKNQRDYPKG